MNMVSVEYRNKEELHNLSSVASEPIEAIVTAYAASINANGEKDIIEKEYHLYVGKSIDIDELKGEVVLGDEEINKLKQEGIFKFVKNEMGVIPVRKEDTVLENSQSLIVRVDWMLVQLDRMGYKTAPVSRENVSVR